jgi:hypothetical protein
MKRGGRPPIWPHINFLGRSQRLTRLNRKNVEAHLTAEKVQANEK